ncbi:MAG: hypothetical protein KC496_09260 [Anaerolineae bacterium]|nr:hypothetical protein [Anaerolineae bacterium]
MEPQETSTALKLITQTLEQLVVAEPPAPSKTETQLMREAVARVIAKSDCDCTLQGSSVWDSRRGFVTTYSYVDQYGRNWGYDSTCGGQVKPASHEKPESDS